jgi:hypothetical protein
VLNYKKTADFGVMSENFCKFECGNGDTMSEGTAELRHKQKQKSNNTKNYFFILTKFVESWFTD